MPIIRIVTNFGKKITNFIPNFDNFIKKMEKFYDFIKFCTKKTIKKIFSRKKILKFTILSAAGKKIFSIFLKNI